MWPFSSQQRLGDPISVAGLRNVLEVFDDELEMRLSSDGRMRLSHRITPAMVVATLDLVDGYPWIEQVGFFPRLLKDDVTGSWEEFEWHVDPSEDNPSVASGPFLLIEVEDGKQVDVYTDAPFCEEGAVPTRSLTNRDVAGGWFVDRMQRVFATSRVRIRGRRPPARWRV